MIASYLIIGAIALASAGMIATRAPSAYLMIGAIALAAAAVMAAGYADAYAGELPPTIEACESDTECEDAARVLCDAGVVSWCDEEIR